MEISKTITTKGGDVIYLHRPMTGRLNAEGHGVNIIFKGKIDGTEVIAYPTYERGSKKIKYLEIKEIEHEASREAKETDRKT